jgi:hypothetical protein
VASRTELWSAFRSGTRMHPALEELLTRASLEVQMLAALTPIDVATERARLVEALHAGRSTCPQWKYAPVAPKLADLRRALDAAERALETEVDANPGASLALATLDRVRELGIEAALCAAVGTDDVARLARARFAPPDAALVDEASALCASWLAGAAVQSSAAVVASDDPDPRSLLSRLRAEVGRLRLPFAVVVQPALAPLASTGARVILVSPGRLLSEEDVARTVLHEIEGHARPRARAATASQVLFRVGTARGNDDQEGLALLFEERGGHLRAPRCRQLAARHRAVEAMLGGASFPEVATMLLRDYGLEAGDAVIAAERIFRGSDGLRPGLGRERVYLESFVRVRTHLAARPDDERVLASGQVSLDAVGALAPFVPPAAHRASDHGKQTV